jgi:hypothetical protein
MPLEFELVSEGVLFGTGLSDLSGLSGLLAFEYVELLHPASQFFFIAAWMPLLLFRGWVGGQ